MRNKNCKINSYDPELLSFALSAIAALGGLGGILGTIQYIQSCNREKKEREYKTLKNNKLKQDMKTTFDKIRRNSHELRNNLLGMCRLVSIDYMNADDNSTRGYSATKSFGGFEVNRFGTGKLILSRADFNIFTMYQNYILNITREFVRNTTIAEYLIANNEEWCFTYEAQYIVRQLTEITDMLNKVLSNIMEIPPEELFKRIDVICSAVDSISFPNEHFS